MTSEPMIRIHDVHKSFASLRVLKGISFTVAKGETVCVLGRSGTGKSVLLKSIIGLLDPDRGHIEVLGKRFAEMNEQQRLRHRQSMGYVFQGAALFDSLTVLENVGFSLYQARMSDAEIRRRVQQRLDMVGLANAIDQYPSQLSGGMQKRVGLARALIEDPQIILYDEPTSGLDPLTTDVINRIILRLRNRLHVTSVVVTHDIRSAFTIGDRVIILDGGQILAAGTPGEIEKSDLPWVQHFITGQALESEIIDGGTSRIRSGRPQPPSAALERITSKDSATRRRAIRRKRRPSDDNNHQQPS